MSSFSANEDGAGRAPNRIEQDALHWLAILDRGATKEQEEEFERWLKADHRHAEYFGELNGTWGLLDRVNEISEADIEEAHPEILPARKVAEGEQHSPRRGWTLWSWAIPAAAAAAILVYTMAWGPVARVDYAKQVVTEMGGLRTIKLPDGSIMQVNTDSAVEVRFTSTERCVDLVQGEVHFTVTPNRARPFIVRVAGMDVQAVGTAFNVRMRSESVEVLVTEGKVRLKHESLGEQDGAGASFAGEDRPVEEAPAANAKPKSPAVEPASMLAAGERITLPRERERVKISAPIAPISVPPVEIGRSLAWQARRLEFVDTALADMVAEFNRYNQKKLVIADRTLGEQRFGGTFRSKDVDGFVRTLEANFGVRAERGDDRITLQSAEGR